MLPSICCRLALTLSLLVFTSWRAVARADALDVEPEQLRPGLVAVMRSLDDPERSLTRIDVKPAFHLGHSSPHPRLPGGPFEALWTGLVWIKDRGPITFDAWVGGEVTVEIDGIRVLQGRGDSDTAHITGRTKLERERGYYPASIRYRSLARVPARLQLGWEGPTFAHEPIPAWHWKHDPAKLPVAVRQEELASRGREAVGQLGCARCHAGAFPGVSDPPPGPALTDLGARLSRPWLLRWLDNPAAVHSDARMPALFTNDRAGFVERWLVTDALLGSRETRPAPEPAAPGDHRLGRQLFIRSGCAACHLLPDLRREDQADLGRLRLRGLGDRLPAGPLAAFLANPHARYPDDRMPRIPLAADAARNIAAYLLLWSSPVAQAPGSSEPKPVEPPTRAEIDTVVRRLKARDAATAGAALLREKRCAVCHPGLEAMPAADVPVTNADAAGCLSGRGTPRYTLDADTLKVLGAYRKIACQETHPAPFAGRQRLLRQAGCLRCHARDSDRPPPLEEAGSTLGGAFLQNVPFQRTPRLNDTLQKYTRAHLARAIREGVTGLRGDHYSYHMPAFGTAADTLVQALAEGDGELPAGDDPPVQPPADPTLGPLAGSQLAGFQGYACVSCHQFQGRHLSQPDPGAFGPELTRLTGRIRRDWFDRFLEDPARSHPNTPMPAIFQRGKPALLKTVLDGDPGRQKDALWSYFALGPKAPSPKPPPPMAVAAPAADAPPLAALIPIRLPDNTLVESLSILYGSHDLIVYDVNAATAHSGFTGAHILREVQGRLRRFLVSGTPLPARLAVTPAYQLLGGDNPEPVQTAAYLCHDLLPDGVCIHSRLHFSTSEVELAETLRLVTRDQRRRLHRQLRFTGVPHGRSIELQTGAAESMSVEVEATTGRAVGTTAENIFRAVLTPNKKGRIQATVSFLLPAARPAPAVERPMFTDTAPAEGSLDRPGYRAIPYPRPRAPTGEDLLMPGALAVHPRDGRVFIASMKLGEVLVLRDPTGDGKMARYENYARGLFQEAYSLLAEEDALYVLHRRNLTRIVDAERGGLAGRLERMALLPHGAADTYDYAYGLARDRGGFVFSYAPYANTTLPGSGGAVRLTPGKPPEEIAFGMRNPFGWCNGPDGDVFFTDNQGEWVATNKLCHLAEGRFYGFPNQAQKQHVAKPAGLPAVWVPYDWARSLNGVTFDNTGGKFGPFAGQFFLAELMFGGAIVRAQLEKVNGVYQGACFPFWGKGLLGPLCLAFDPKGRLWVGSITEPGWMAQPDRGALYRIDYTGTPPFEIQSIHVRPRGFRLTFTTPVSAESARRLASYQVEHFRYEYTGAYGSPELDRTRVAVERVAVAEDGRSVELTTGSLVKGRVYMIAVPGVRSAKGETLVHPTGAYTLHEVPEKEN
jgi:glucose/arabinose dehydrogenase/mono/diheme cytochrome c family protein